MRRGLTLIELLTVIGIISIIAALGLPAVQHAREAARRVQCKNRMHQLAIGVLKYEARSGRYPGNGGYTSSSRIADPSGHPVQISTTDYSNGLTFLWGIGESSKGSRAGSWGWAILSDIGEGAILGERAVEIPIATFLCPSRIRGDLAQLVDDGFGEYRGAGRVWARTDFAMNDHLARNLPDPPRSSASVRDGLAHTILIGEKAFDHFVQKPSSWYYDEPIWSGGSNGTARNGVGLVPDGRGIDFKNNWGSPHAVCLFVLADGSTNEIDFEVDRQIFQELIEPAGAR
jgi:prepilin-type N-terminal cleavage/methylation domain-containing protein